MPVPELQRGPTLTHGVGARPPIARRGGPFSEYPMLRPSLQWGIVSGLVAFAISLSPAMAFAGFTGPLLIGLLWNRHLAPALPFALAFQWLFTVTGIACYYVTGTFPVDVRCSMQNLELAMLLSDAGLLVFALGLRWGMGRVEPLLAEKQLGQPPRNQAVVMRLVILSIVLAAAAMLLPKSLFAHSAISQLTRRIVGIKDIALLSLLSYCIYYRIVRSSVVVAFLFAWSSSFVSAGSAFSFLLFALFILIWEQWRPWVAVRRSTSQFAGKAFPALVVLAGVMVFAGIIWNGRIKGELRDPKTGIAKQAGTVNKVRFFLETAAASAQGPIVTQTGPERFLGRLSSDLAYFGMVVWRVPVVVPYENGAITAQAIQHVLMPRLLFPGKTRLGSDSTMTRKYTGIYVAGEESGTSIGIGYIGLFFADLGVPLMFLPLLGWGLLVGVFLRVLIRKASNVWIVNAICIVFALENLTSYGGSVAKVLGGQVWSVLVLYGLVWLGGSWWRSLFRTK